MQNAGLVLPALRQELRLLPGPVGTGEQSRLIYDPVRHRYYQISKSAFELLQLWSSGPADALVKRAQAELERPVAEAEVAEIVKFVFANHLSLEPANDDALSLAKQEARTQRSLLSRIMHGYLFFKIPLVRPERFLKATLPMVEPLFSRASALLLVLITLAGLYFVSRQWNVFVATFLDLATVEGAFIFGIALVIVKSLHELGHAYAATRLGVRANSMGIAFMVLMPMLYTDVTDAWRLRKQNDKLMIDVAGIAVELAIAGVATFLWAFLADGPWRTAAFVVATSSWIMSLVVNLNPLMRFDGYYLLADAWQIPNLSSRSNALAQWWLRERLFGLGHGPPELVQPRRRRLMILYALCVWVYRFFLFLGIALLVYYMFFKALGIVLFVIEIVWFILLPIFREIMEWWKMRSEIITTRRSLVTAGLISAAIVAFAMPWSGTVRIQAVASYDLETVIFAPRPARLVAVEIQDQAAVVADDTLIVLEAPDLEHELSQTRKRIALVQLRLARIAGDEADLSNRIVLESELARHETNLAGLEAEQSRLVVRSPHAGIARDVDLDLKPGEWIDEATPIARVVRTATVEIQGYLTDDEVWRVSDGAEVTFVPEDPTLASSTGRVLEVVQTGVRTISGPYLSSVYGGAIASDRNSENEIRPRTGLHLVRARLDGVTFNRVVRGTLHLSGRRESMASAMWRRILQVLVRESSA
jgi:putative peptide zinc metalloprotease protein